MAIPNVNAITSDLRMMSDQQLQQYAAMHKNDPYILPMAVSESNARKQMRMQAQGAQGMQPQPKVADADIAAMLPEEQGIGALPVQNMQHMADGGIVGYADGGELNYTGDTSGPLMDMSGGGEPVTRMAEGGIAHFADTGRVQGGFTPEMQQFLAEQARINNVDPNTLLAIIRAESGNQPGAKSKTSSAHGLFQITDQTFKGAGGNPSKRNDPFENIRVGAKLLGDNAKVLRNQLQREPKPDELYATHFLGTGTGSKLLQANPDTPMAEFLQSADAKRAGNIMSSNKSMLQGKSVGDVRQTLANKMFNAIPVGAANAAPPPAAVPGDLASQIPGQRMQAPASDYDQTNSYFGRLADTLGIPQEYQRNINNTLNAGAGWTSPVNTANRMVGAASGALKATPEMIAKAQQARQVADTPRLMAPAKAGLEALEAGAQETRAAATAARQARNLEQDRKAATAAEQSVKAADMTADLARATEEGIAAGPNARALDSAKAANAARALSVNQFGESMLSNRAAADAETKDKGQSPYDVEDMRKADEMPTKKEAIDVAKEAIPAKERKGYDDEDLLMFGLNLLAGKSQYALQNVGEAGVAALKNKKEREKTEQDIEYKDIMKKYYGALGEQAGAASKKYAAEAGILESGEKGRTADRQKAAAGIESAMEAWAKSKAGMFTPQEETAQRNALTKYYMNFFNLDLPSTMATTAPDSQFKVLGSRPS